MTPSPMRADSHRSTMASAALPTAASTATAASTWSWVLSPWSMPRGMASSMIWRKSSGGTSWTSEMTTMTPR